jgi:hypothetical protein
MRFLRQLYEKAREVNSDRDLLDRNMSYNLPRKEKFQAKTMKKLLLASIMDEAAIRAVAALANQPLRGLRVAYFSVAAIPE